MRFVDKNAPDQGATTTTLTTPPVEQRPFPTQVTSLPVEQLSISVPITSLPIEQTPFPGEQTTPADGMQQIAQPQVQELMIAPPTRALTHPFASQPGTTTSLRQPLIIRGSNQKRSVAVRPTIRRRLLIQLAVVGLLIFIMAGTALAVTPIDSQGHSALSLLSPIVNSSIIKGNNTAHLVQQAATATAILSRPGYDPGAPTGYVPPGSDSQNRFTYGQCTYWADERYYQLTGVRVPWMGNAYQWAAGARQYGWNVSSTPHVPSIIVLQPGTQYASSYYGHVAVVESISANGTTVHTSNWNWGGGYATTTYVDFTVGSGVSFVWAPGK